jgi:hypothetical protein
MKLVMANIWEDYKELNSKGIALDLQQISDKGESDW